MLSTITPMTEVAKGHRFRVTAWWYVVGATLGGLSLGLLLAGPAALFGRLTLPEETRLLVVALGALVGVMSDGRLFGFQLPGHDRQVNERWLDRYRSWIYGVGFGWQIGFGLSTYIMTAGVYLLVVSAVASGSVFGAVLLCTLFGVIRGLAVFSAADITSQDSMADFHRRFESWRQPVRKAMIAVLGVVGVLAGLASGEVVGVVAAAGAAICAGVSLRNRRETSYRIRPARAS
jgi:cytochrome c biogenesis protein CcdA